MDSQDECLIEKWRREWKHLEEQKEENDGESIDDLQEEMEIIESRKTYVMQKKLNKIKTAAEKIDQMFENVQESKREVKENNYFDAIANILSNQDVSKINSIEDKPASILSPNLIMDGCTEEYFICGICDSLLDKPVECLECCSVFCESCLMDYQNVRRIKCPEGCELKEFPVHAGYKELNKHLQRKLDELKVRCPQSADGCEFQGSVY